jgi:hypothetical protein
MSTVRNCLQYDCPPIRILNCVKVLRTWKKAFDVILEEFHISLKVIPTPSRIGRLEWLYISYLEESEYLVFIFQTNLKHFLQTLIYKMYHSGNQRATKFDSYTVWQRESVRATQIDSYTLWQLHSVTAKPCDCYTVWELQSLTDTQCDNYREIYLLIVTATVCDSYTFPHTAL